MPDIIIKKQDSTIVLIHLKQDEIYIINEMAEKIIPTHRYIS
jgi:hypothetical protein